MADGKRIAVLLVNGADSGMADVSVYALLVFFVPLLYQCRMYSAFLFSADNASAHFAHVLLVFFVPLFPVYSSFLVVEWH